MYTCVMDFAIILASVVLSLAVTWGSERWGLHDYLVGTAKKAAQDLILYDLAHPADSSDGQK